METRIYYFSATGNSLAMARRIAEALGDTELVSIPKSQGKDIGETNVVAVGFVFPVYAYGVPRLVEDFMKKIRLRKNQYIFAVATAGGTAGNTLGQFRGFCRRGGADLNAGFIVKEDGHGPMTVNNPIIRFMRDIGGAPPASGRERLAEIVETVRNRRGHRMESSRWLANILGDLLHGFASKAFKTADRAYWVDDQCNGCGICQRTCPRGNIRIEAGKPVWQHDCESCFGCLQWCPRKAVQLGQQTLSGERSHNKDVAVGDVILR